MEELKEILLSLGFDADELNKAHLQLFIAYEGCHFGLLAYVPPFIDNPQFFIKITDTGFSPSLLEIYTDIESIKNVTAHEYLCFIDSDGIPRYSDSAPVESRICGNFALRLSCTRMLIKGFTENAQNNNIKAELIK